MSSSAAKRLAGKTILVTGASSGIGRSVALEFARTSPKDLRLILAARRLDSLREVAANISTEVGNGVKVLPVQLDVSDPRQVRSFVGNLPQEWKDIQILVNNASVYRNENPLAFPVSPPASATEVCLTSDPPTVVSSRASREPLKLMSRI